MSAFSIIGLWMFGIIFSVSEKEGKDRTSWLESSLNLCFCIQIFYAEFIYGFIQEFFWYDEWLVTE